MSVRHVLALVMGWPGSGKTTLITRWITGGLPTDETKSLPFNGVKSINVTFKKHKELALVRLVDGSDASDDDLRRLCHKADVIVACMSVEFNGMDEQEVKRLNGIFTTSRPPIVVLGTMRDLRDSTPVIQLMLEQDQEADSHSTTSGDAILKLDRRPSKLTVDNVFKHRVSFSVEANPDRNLEAEVTSPEDLSDGEERNLTSLSDGFAELDSSSVSLDLQAAMAQRKNPAFWSTESIHGSLATTHDQSRDSNFSLEHSVEERLLKIEEDTENRSCTNEAFVSDNDNVQVLYQKPLIETHFPLTSDTPLTVKRFPLKENDSPSKLVIPYKDDDWFSEDEPEDLIFRGIKSPLPNSTSPFFNEAKNDIHLGSTSQNAHEDQNEGPQLKGDNKATPHEDRNFHVNLDPEPVKLIDHDPEVFQPLSNYNGYCKTWTTEDGRRLSRYVKGDTYMECSAITGENLQDVFQHIAVLGCKYNKKMNDRCSIA